MGRFWMAISQVRLLFHNNLLVSISDTKISCLKACAISLIPSFQERNLCA